MKKKKTALVFSGGGAKGSFQIGVWKALREMGIKIDMVFGTSIGAVNGVMVVMNHFDQAESLWKEIVTQEVFDIETNGNLENLSILGMPADQLLGYAKEVAKGGAEKTSMAQVFDKYIDEKTFFRSKVDYGLCMTEFPSLKGRQVYKEEIPKGMVGDFVMASASCFPFAKPTEIKGTSYIDGGYYNNFPVDMALECEADRIIAVDLGAIGVVDKKMVDQVSDRCEFIYIQPTSDLGNFLYFDPASAETNIQLGYLATLRKFGKLDGVTYSFKKDEFTKKELIGAEYAASHFGLDPREIYTREILNQDLKMRVLDAQVAAHKQTGHIPFNLAEIDKEDFRTFVSNLKEKYQVTSLIVLIAEYLRDNNHRLVLKTSLAKKLLKDELAAARYIVSQELLHS